MSNNEDNYLLFKVSINKFGKNIIANNKEYMTKKELKKFNKYLNRCFNISAWAYVRNNEDLISEANNRLISYSGNLKPKNPKARVSKNG